MPIIAKNISVSFPGVKALSDASFRFEENRIHAVLGANGSGKSTLVKVLTGNYHPDKNCNASIDFNGNIVSDILTPRQADSLGVRVVHQESPLLNTFTVAECVALFKGFPKKGFRIDWKRVNSYINELLELYNIKVDPQMLTDDLTAADRNMIAMAMAMGNEEEMKSTKLLVLDEADASIPESETESFLQRVHYVANLGIPVVMVTHRMKEVMSYCDDISILNGGKLVFTGLKDDVNENFIISKMIRQGNDVDIKIGEEQTTFSMEDLWKLLDKQPPKKTSSILELQHLVAKGLNDVSFTVRSGEILGIIGNPDSGVKELPMVLGGDLEIESGTYMVENKVLPKSLSPRKAYQSGVSVLPSDRPTRGCIMSCTLQENLLLPNLIQYWNKSKLAKKTMAMCVDIFDIHPGNNYSMLFGKFSGGNQQKAIMAKWLSTCPKVFVLDDPTYGVDPASRIRIFEAIKEAADKQVAMVIFSTEPEQLVNICTRMIALHNGEIKAELTPENGLLTRQEIARWCYL